MVKSLIALHRNGEINLDVSSTDNFVAGSPLGQSKTGGGYSLFKAGQTTKFFVGPSLNDRKSWSGVDMIPTVIESPSLVELVETDSGSLIASGVSFAIGDSVYVDADGRYTNVATGNALTSGIVRGINPLIIKF